MYLTYDVTTVQNSTKNIMMSVNNGKNIISWDKRTMGRAKFQNKEVACYNKWHCCGCARIKCLQGKRDVKPCILLTFSFSTLSSCVQFIPSLWPILRFVISSRIVSMLSFLQSCANKTWFLSSSLSKLPWMKLSYGVFGRKYFLLPLSCFNLVRRLVQFFACVKLNVPWSKFSSHLKNVVVFFH